MSPRTRSQQPGPFEHKSEPLLPVRAFRLRILRAGSASLVLVAASLALGTVGYRATEGWAWLDAALNAAMILTGMGQVSAPRTDAGKLFAIAYALFSGVVFLTTVALVLAPLAHRMLHAFHLELDGDA